MQVIAQGLGETKVSRSWQARKGESDSTLLLLCGPGHDMAAQDGGCGAAKQIDAESWGEPLSSASVSTEDPWAPFNTGTGCYMGDSTPFNAEEAAQDQY
ncbi:hypothetical protein NDU88_003120 [Pleurodeles waltl]|uniref:Uncharacterized protein n=1 Tax=Pleurodeles waltl TaxID=8319 RepID=A0AAV7NQ19_PLEWA|nr:hypothetical protein NDU88_003120 [Pleurodeles waltl]